MTNLEKFKPLLARLNFLICSDNSTDKTSWKKFFVDIGVPVGNISTVASYEEADEALEEKPDVFLLGYRLKGVVGLSLVKKHIDLIPDRRRAWCFVCSENNSLALAASLAEKNVDALVLKPYNPNDLELTLVPALESKLEMGKSTELFYEILADIRQENLDQAAQKLAAFTEKVGSSSYPKYLEGLLLEEKNNIDDAIECYYKALEFDEKNYHVLTRLFDLLFANADYSGAYECAEAICENYPVDPERIPNMIRASVATKNFQNLIDFCEALLGIDGDIGGISKAIAAALILSAKHLADDTKNRDVVIDAIRRGVSLTDPKEDVFVIALETLLKIENLQDTKKLLDMIPSDEMDEDLLAIDLHFLYLSSGAQAAFNRAQDLIRIDSANEKSFEILLKSGKEIGKPKDKLEDLAYDAAKVFPECKTHFLSLIE